MSRLDLVPTGYVRHQKFITHKGEKRYACLVKLHNQPQYLRLYWRTATAADIYGEAVMHRYQRLSDYTLARLAKEPAKAVKMTSRKPIQKAEKAVLEGSQAR